MEKDRQTAICILKSVGKKNFHLQRVGAQAATRWNLVRFHGETPRRFRYDLTESDRLVVAAQAAREVATMYEDLLDAYTAKSNGQDKETSFVRLRDIVGGGVHASAVV